MLKRTHNTDITHRQRTIGKKDWYNARPVDDPLIV